MKFNTAVLYDLENLIGGYSLSHIDLLVNLSLKQITEQIKLKNIGKIAIQRAYADWSVSRLNQLKSDIVKLGIEPKQMFGFGKNVIKNASDIHLAVDAMEILFTKPDIEIFIIVSGDGGFSSLANKLHEYGKVVIGCGYKRNCNKIFEAISDDFIWLDEQNGPAGQCIPEACGDFGENYLVTFARQYKPLEDAAGMQSALKVSKEILGFIGSHHNLRYKMISQGMNISVFFELMQYRLSGFKLKALGFPKSTDFIQEAIKGTELKLILRGGTDYRITLKNKVIPGFDDIGGTHKPSREHTPENYRLILSSASPSFRQFDKKILSAVSGFLCENKDGYQNILLDDITKNLNKKFDYDSLEIIKTVTSLISGGCFMMNSDCNNLARQLWSYVPHNTEQAFTLLEKTMQIKLANKLDRIDSRIFNSILN